jgi:hypothetical protein
MMSIETMNACFFRSFIAARVCLIGLNHCILLLLVVVLTKAQLVNSLSLYIYICIYACTQTHTHTHTLTQTHKHTNTHTHTFRSFKMQLINALFSADSTLPRRGGAEEACQGRGRGGRNLAETRNNFATDKGYVKLRCGIFSDGPADLEIHFGPVKKVSRMREKLLKYKWTNEGMWPR